MFRPTVLGLAACAIGIVVVIFEAINSMMTPGEVVMNHATPASLLGDDRLAWIGDISWIFVQDGIDFLVHAPVFALIIAVGLVLLVIGMILK